jgi:hypothetical protein
MSPVIKGPITIGPDMSEADKEKLREHVSIDGQLKRLSRLGIVKYGKAEKLANEKLVGEVVKKKRVSRKRKVKPSMIARAARRLKKTVDDLADDGKLNDSVGGNNG